MSDLEITPLEVKQRLDRGEKLLVRGCARTLGIRALPDRRCVAHSHGIDSRESAEAGYGGRRDLLLPPRDAQPGRRELAARARVLPGKIDGRGN